MPVAHQTLIPLPKWGGVSLPALIVEEEGAYIPVKLLCAVLMGTVDDRPHRARIKRDPILNQLWRFLPVQTSGGQQDMFCLEHTGVARWIDRLDLGKVREDIRPRILAFMWDVTLAARRALYGEVESRNLPAFHAIVPHNRTPVTIRDEDAKRLLLALADRIGKIEISQREMQGLLVALATGALDSLPLSCPQCGYPWQDGNE